MRPATAPPPALMATADGTTGRAHPPTRRGPPDVPRGNPGGRGHHNPNPRRTPHMGAKPGSPEWKAAEAKKDRDSPES